MRSRAILGVVSVSAVLLPAIGITYLGVVSYSSDRGVVAAKVDEQQRQAQGVAASTVAEISSALEAAAEVFEGASAPPSAVLEELARRHPVAARPFRIGPNGELSYPRADPLVSDTALPSSPLDWRRPSTCPEAAFERCVREIRAQRRRETQLDQARRAELAACQGGSCQASAMGEARRAYQSLVRYDDSAAEALLGLARIDRLAGAADKAAAHYAELSSRFEDRQTEDGIPYRLLGELGHAELTGDQDEMVAVYNGLLRGRYAGSAEAMFALARYVSAHIDRAALGPERGDELAELDAIFDRLAAEAAMARALEVEVGELFRNAGSEMRGRPVQGGATQTLVYRREPGGAIVGMVIDDSRIEDLIARVGKRELRGRARAVVHPIGRLPDRSSNRTLASASFGLILPQYELSLVNSITEPDPLDEIVDARSRRHLWISGGLAIALVIGIVVTIRNAARERELARLKSDFVSTVSHELKTPLTSVRMFAEMLQQGVADGDRERESRYQDIIVKESERLGLLITNLLDYSQIERGTRRYSEEVVPASELARESVLTFRRLQEERPLDIELDLDDGKARVQVDRQVMVQCLLNLLSNAVKYAGDGAPVTVSVATEDTGVVLAVRDRGPGIPRSEHSKVWEEFYRTPSAYSSGIEGTGLGLALVKRHVEAHGGKVGVDNAEPGARFTITLPRSGETEEMDEWRRS